ncbi:MAG: multicopper oxidase domain-containing protein, partial [bacterium]
MAALLAVSTTSNPSGGALAADYELIVENNPINVTGRQKLVPQINGSVPGSLLRLRQGEDATIRVTNRLDEPTSIHWHGIILPANMDGVPGISFGGIAPGTTFTYRFPVKQSGTYWYHSHSELQEQAGMYAPIIIEPTQREPYRYDREHVVMLSDWTDEDPHTVFAKLKKQNGYYNFQKRTISDFFRDVAEKGLGTTISDRLEWGRMRMDPTDIADVTGYTYTFLINGQPPGANWTALFEPRERVRLRFINGSAMTYFDVRIPGLSMTVVQADGQDV